jgi:hypothetical protein
MLGAMSRLALVVSLLSLVLGGACSKSKSDDGPPCTTVVDNMMMVTKQAMSGHGDLEVQNRKVMIDQCEKRSLTAAQKTCLATAKDLAGIAACTPRPAVKP